MNDNVYVVVGRQAWNRQVFDKVIRHYYGTWHFIGSRENLTLKNLSAIAPHQVFFLHWSDKVPDEIIDNFECINFHMTDVPYGRGGSPLQNLIVRGHRSTKLTALRMTSAFDAGPVYLKHEMSLEASTAEEIYIRASYLSAEMILEIVSNSLSPIEQEGDVTIFKRRKPKESEIPRDLDTRALHDFIRMLDADGYPSAYIEYGGYRFEFKRASQYHQRIEASVTITPIEQESE